MAIDHNRPFQSYTVGGGSPATMKTYYVQDGSVYVSPASTASALTSISGAIAGKLPPGEVRAIATKGGLTHLSTAQQAEAARSGKLPNSR